MDELRGVHGVEASVRGVEAGVRGVEPGVRGVEDGVQEVEASVRGVQGIPFGFPLPLIFSPMRGRSLQPAFIIHSCAIKYNVMQGLQVLSFVSLFN